MSNATISLYSLGKKFKQGDGYLTVLKNITEVFHQSTTYALTGSSGAGKSTLLHIIAGIEAPTTGFVKFNEENLTILKGQKRDQFFNKNIGLIFQLPYLINELTVLENVMLKGLIGGDDREKCEETAYVLLEQVNLKEKALCFPQILSGGQQQRVAIARALFNKPVFLLADEPTGNLDERTGHALIELLISYQKDYETGLIISSHDPYVTKKMEITLHLQDGFLMQNNSVTKESKNVKRSSNYFSL